MTTSNFDTTNLTARRLPLVPAGEREPALGPDLELVARAGGAILGAREFARHIGKPDGHHCAELESNTAITAEYVFLRQALGLELASRREAMVKYFFAQQKKDGSWGLATNHAGDVSTTAETYLALRILDVGVRDPRMQRAQEYVLVHGGLEKMRVFTRIFFAMFGLFPWDAVPSLPAEFILLPPSSPVNVYALSSWARGTIVPLLLILHYKPLFALPNGKSPENDWLDHLWINARKKHLPYADSLLRVAYETGASWGTFFTAADRVLHGYERVQSLGGPFRKLRARALAAAETWMLERQEPNGDWAGIFPPMLNVVLALYASGRALSDPAMARGLEALERFGVHDDAGYRVEPCQSPVWDTILMAIGLLDTGDRGPHVAKAIDWVVERQIFAQHGDWRVYNPEGKPGGWSFEYTNTWYPDVDDTAAIVIGLLKHDPALRTSDSVKHAVEWMVSMQNDDGGWAAFDKKNDKLFLNEIPFSDMDALCDPSTPDIVGRVLEALGILNDPAYRRIEERGIEYLRKNQEPEGSFFGRWGVNYVYGTSNVLCGLARQRVPGDDAMVRRAVAWLKSVQNTDGGWGECLESYGNRTLMGKGASTASQTAWGLMGLLAYLPREDAAVKRGVRWLVERQNTAGSWDEEEFTGTGFPNHFYLRYNLYRHYFPLMALGRYVGDDVPRGDVG
jgi:squalene-hopene/tetraprenyl-beta-curcumene cyclase